MYQRLIPYLHSVDCIYRFYLIWPFKDTQIVYLLFCIPYLKLNFFFLKVDAWKTHVWHDETRRPRKKEIKFSILAK